MNIAHIAFCSIMLSCDMWSVLYTYEWQKASYVCGNWHGQWTIIECCGIIKIPPTPTQKTQKTHITTTNKTKKTSSLFYFPYWPPLFVQNPGRLKLQRNSIIFKNNKTGKVDQFQSSELDKCQWLKRARGHCLKLVLKSGNIHRYDGFKETVRLQKRFQFEGCPWPQQLQPTSVSQCFVWKAWKAAIFGQQAEAKKTEKKEQVQKTGGFRARPS